MGWKLLAKLHDRNNAVFFLKKKNPLVSPCESARRTWAHLPAARCHESGIWCNHWKAVVLGQSTEALSSREGHMIAIAGSTAPFLVATSSEFELEQVQKASFSISSTKSFLLERSGYKVLLPKNKERAFGPLPYQKKEDWTGVILPSINCLFPPCPKKEAPELIAFCGQPEEGEGNKVQVCLSRATWSYTRILCGLHQVTTLLVAGKSSGWSLVGHQGAVSHVAPLFWGETMKKQGRIRWGSVSDWLGWTVSKQDRLKPLATECSLETPRFKSKFALGPVFFPKEQLAPKLRLN